MGQIRAWTMSDYASYISDKLVRVQPTGFDPPQLHDGLFPHQQALTSWALRRGRCAVFADTGLGKTRIQLEWAAKVHEHTGMDVLILAPLAVTAMQRTKALGLLHKTVRGNASMSRQGIPDYLVTMRHPAEVEERVMHADTIPVSEWQKLASPIWMDINPSDTLQYRSAREHDDERHICPLQLEVIRRGVRLWTNPNDVVLSPFMGIASEGHVALEQGRRFVGVELKTSYYEQAVRNLQNASKEKAELFTQTTEAE